MGEMDPCTCMAESLSCSPAAITMLLIGCQFSSVAQLCVTLCDPMDSSMPGFPLHHQLLQPAQTHIHRVGDAIQPSKLLSSPSPPAFNLTTSGSFPMSQFFASGGRIGYTPTQNKKLSFLSRFCKHHEGLDHTCMSLLCAPRVNQMPRTWSVIIVDLIG